MLRIFRSSTKRSGSRILVWALLGLLAAGLVGFNVADVATGLAGRTVAEVGDEEVTRDDYARALETAVRAFSQRAGVNLTVSQAVSFGLHEQVLAQLVTEAALDNQADRLGLSVGDETVRAEILSRPEFQGSSGFDPDTYRFTLERSGFTVPDYEARVREDVARALLEAGVSGGVVAPAVMAETLVAYDRETRDFSYVQLTPSGLDVAVEAPDDAALRAFHAENAAAYRAPERRRVSYAALRPEDLAEEIDVSEEELRAAYEDQIDRFSRPERRILDRLAFGTEAEAAAARDRIETGETTLEAEAEARGIDPAAIEIGEVRPRDLDRAAREAVFGAEGPGLVGPVTTDFGPTLFRVNAILAGRTTPFEEARETLRSELALEEAEARIGARIEEVEDLLAAGATLEEVGEETALRFGTTEVAEGATGPLAGDQAFRSRAEGAEPGDLPELFELSGGGIAALRLDEVIPPEDLPFEEVADRVRADWLADARQEALAERGEALLDRLREGRTLEAVAEAEGLGIGRAEGRARRDVPEGLSAEVLARAFEMEPGEVALVDGGNVLTLLRLDRVTEFDAADAAEAVELRQSQLSQQIAFEMLEGFAEAAQAEAGVRVNRDLIQRIVELYN